MLHFSMKIKSGLNTWGLGTFYGFLDQGLFSSTNFIISILLARWIPEEDYGAFAVAFSFYILFSTVHSALITEPMLVFGSTQHEDRLSEYISNQIGVHILMVLILSLLLAFGATFTIPMVHSALMGASFAMPFTLLLWLFRRACYIKMQTNIAFTLSLIYSIVIFFGLWLLHYLSILSPRHAFYLMGLGSMIACLPAFYIFKIKTAWLSLINKLLLKDKIILENWHFGKWILVSFIADGIINLSYPTIIGLVVNLSQAAAFRSMQNLILPLQQIHAAISLMVIPWLSKKADRLGISYVYKKLPKLIGVYIVTMIIYTIPLIIFSRPLSTVIYGNRFYDNFTWLIPLLSISYVFTSIGIALAVSLRSIKLTKPLLWSKISAAFVILTVGFLIISKWELHGVVVTIYLSTIVECFILIFIFIKLVNRTALEKLSNLQG